MKFSTLFVFLLGVALFPVKSFAADIEAGKTKFQTYCVTCHGPEAKGDGVAAAALNPKPRNLQATTKTDAEMKKVIKEGGPSMGLSTTMAAWGTVLSDSDIDNIIAYVRSITKK